MVRLVTLDQQENDVMTTLIGWWHHKIYTVSLLVTILSHDVKQMGNIHMYVFYILNTQYTQQQQ